MRFLLATLLLSASLYAQTCDFIVSPTTLTIGAAATTDGRISVTQPGPCIFTGWNVISNISWLHITSGLGYNGSGNVIFTADANVTAFPRQGAMTVATKTVTITQSATLCNFAIARGGDDATGRSRGSCSPAPPTRTSA